MLDNEGKEFELSKAPHFAFDTDFLTLYLKHLPTDVKRLELSEKLSDSCPGFVHLSLSEPMRSNNFQRLAWASFDTIENCDNALAKMPEVQVGDHQMQAVKSYPNKKRAPVRICPPLPES